MTNRSYRPHLELVADAARFGQDFAVNPTRAVANLVRAHMDNYGCTEGFYEIVEFASGQFATAVQSVLSACPSQRNAFTDAHLLNATALQRAATLWLYDGKIIDLASERVNFDVLDASIRCYLAIYGFCEFSISQYLRQSLLDTRTVFDPEAASACADLDAAAATLSRQLQRHLPIALRDDLLSLSQIMPKP